MSRYIDKYFLIAKGARLKTGQLSRVLDGVSDKCFGLVLKEAVCPQCGNQVHDEISDRPMSRMHYLCSVLKHVIDRFNDISFAQYHPVIKGHQLVFHVHSQSCDQLDSIGEKEVEKFLRDIPLVSKQLAIQAFSQHLKHFWVLVADVSPCEKEGDNLPSVIASQMELEPMAPPHGSLAVRGYSLEHPVGITPEIVAYGYHSGVHKCNARASSECPKV